MIQNNNFHNPVLFSQDPENPTRYKKWKNKHPVLAAAVKTGEIGSGLFLLKAAAKIVVKKNRESEETRLHEEQMRQIFNRNYF